MKKVALFLILLATVYAGHDAIAQNGIISTVAGNGTAGYGGDGGTATAAELHYPCAVALDGTGNMYIGDEDNFRIRKINYLGIISTIAGIGSAGYSGDGGAATNASINYPSGIVLDGAGNIYFSDLVNNRVRKINTSGIITTFAGNGSSGYSGDGGNATAAEINHPDGIAIDNDGNMYIADWYNNVVRKVDTFGIITTIAGNGSPGYSGDGGPATAATFKYVSGVGTDSYGNVYVTDGNANVVRKISGSGIITTVAGNGSASYSGDGSMATAAGLSFVRGVTVDPLGDVFIADRGNYCIRKINASGIISTVAGTGGSSGFSGDGGAATAAHLNAPNALTLDAMGNVYISDGDANNRIRKIQDAPTATSDSFLVYVNNTCSGLQFEVIANSFSPAQHVITYFGNGFTLDTLTANILSNGVAYFNMAYASSGNYTIKNILFDGPTAVDSVAYSYTVSLCQNLAISFYHDALGTCVYNDSADVLMPLPVLVEVDSNSIPIDTISATSGLYYTAYGSFGDIYSFRLISCPTGIFLTCPSSGTISDTLFIGSNATKYFGFNCGTSTSFDLAETLGTLTGRHMQTLNLDLSNAYCTPKDATVTLTFSPQYNFSTAWPAPTTVAGNIATWNISGLSFLNSSSNINVTLSVPGAWLIPGDTVMTECVITPIIGDSDTVNNLVIITDTVKSSYDPNQMSVTPKYCIPSGSVSQLQYTILFENTGNDTAHNIYIMDTLSDELDSHSLRIVSASNIMNVSKWNDGTTQNIYKFEFPNINLLDSSHHNQCDGMLVYTINTKAGLAGGTGIFNHAGIYFDDNPVVMTDTVENVVGCIPLVVTSHPLAVADPTIFPNPAIDVLTLKMGAALYRSFTINNMMGQQEMQQAINNATTEVNITILPAGVYFMTFAGDGGAVTQRFVKM